MDKWITLRSASNYPLIHSPCHYGIAASWFPFHLTNTEKILGKMACVFPSLYKHLIQQLNTEVPWLLNDRQKS